VDIDLLACVLARVLVKQAMSEAAPNETEAAGDESGLLSSTPDE
jgi:hypothetical protein